MTQVALAVFLGSAAFLLYVLFGYPLLLALMTRRERRPVRKGTEQKTVSVILPVRNGAAWIRRKLESILALEYPREKTEVLVVSNGSADGTEALVEEYAGRGVRLLRLEEGNKAKALNLAIGQAAGEILFFTDVRQELEPGSLGRLVSCFADPEVGVASGELVIREGESREESNVGLYWRYEKFIRRRLSRLDSVFGATGCIYAMRRSLAVPLPEDCLLDDMYLPLAAFFRGYRVIFEERARAFDYPTALASEFRRKIRTLAGNYQILRAYPGLLRRSNRMWMHYVSHKFARLLLPFALLAAAVSSFGLPGVWAPWAVGSQALFYGIALADPWVKESSGLKRITSPVRTFTVLMAATACAISILFVPAGRLWKPTEVRRARGA
ncbi:MAG: glycosyltransferase family 2 protein [Bryobacterales bacterium]|nr:glycosyltransferase family 2 protein [Bryobacterales bacterium]